jgi:hypothetical protein
VHGNHPVDACPERVVESVVRGVHVGDERVNPGRGHLDGVEDGARRRARSPRDVVVPAVLVAADVGRLCEAGQLGLSGVRRDERMDLELSATREAHVLGRCQGLVAEEQDLVVEECLA